MIQKKILYASIILALAGCQNYEIKGKHAEHTYLQEINNTTVAVDFGPDSRLWRLIPTSDSVYLDYSDDFGSTFSKSVRINQKAQEINVWPENPPVIKVSKSGRIYILYYADQAQSATTFFTYSEDDGKTFSEPILISDHASTDKHYMDKMLVDEHERIYLFWHDTRDERNNEKLGSGVLSLFYTKTQITNSSELINQKISDGICSCCRTATDFSTEQMPVIFARVVYSDGVRDHALIRMNKDESWSTPNRVTYDNWQIDACPEHGPALSIDNQGRSHFTWFTLGDRRKGIFYAHSDNYGVDISEALQLGNINRLPSHPDVLAVNDYVVITWKEFDGKHTDIVVKESFDRGETWQKDRRLLSANSKSGHPALLTNGKKVFLSWTSRDDGHQFIEVR